MKAFMLLMVVMVSLAGCAADRYDIVENQTIVERVAINNVSQDTVTMEFRAPNGQLVRRLICDKWEMECIVWK